MCTIASLREFCYTLPSLVENSMLAHRILGMIFHANLRYFNFGNSSTFDLFFASRERGFNMVNDLLMKVSYSYKLCV